MADFCRWGVELVDDSGKVVIRSSQDVTELANTTLRDDAEDIRLAGPPAEPLIEHKIGPVHPPGRPRLDSWI